MLLSLQKTAKRANIGKRKKRHRNMSSSYYTSSGLVESAGAVQVFNRSIVSNKLRYKTYIGDRDTQSYHEVVKRDPYPGLSIKKDECVCHVQKRSRTSLQNLCIKLKCTIVRR